MAGGMTPRRGRPTLAERAAITQPLADARDGRPGASDVGGRHCWVVDPPGIPGRWPGLLTEWRPGEGGWQGLVVVLAPVAGRPALVQIWVEAARLEDVR